MESDFFKTFLLRFYWLPQKYGKRPPPWIFINGDSRGSGISRATEVSSEPAFSLRVSPTTELNWTELNWTEQSCKSALHTQTQTHWSLAFSGNKFWNEISVRPFFFQANIGTFCVLPRKNRFVRLPSMSQPMIIHWGNSDCTHASTDNVSLLRFKQIPVDKSESSPWIIQIPEFLAIASWANTCITYIHSSRIIF